MHALDAGGGCEAVLLQLQLTRRGTGDAGLTRRAILVCREPQYLMNIGFLWTSLTIIPWRSSAPSTQDGSGVLRVRSPIFEN